MPRLELEITDKLMEKLQKRADDYAVEPSDVAKRILACELVRQETPSWKETLLRMLVQVTEAVKYASEMKQPPPEEKQE